MTESWRLRINDAGPSSVSNDRAARVIVFPLRSGTSRVCRGDAIRWSQQVARGMAAQLNGPDDLWAQHIRGKPKELA
jgi:hypothetical protein